MRDTKERKREREREREREMRLVCVCMCEHIIAKLTRPTVNYV